MNCAECRGACCEEFALELADVRMPTPDVHRWLMAHAEQEDDGAIRFECRCRHLTPAGRCDIYADRPNVCRVYQPGGTDCLETVGRRRTLGDYQRIREASDPRVLP